MNMRPVNAEKYNEWLNQLKASVKEVASIEDIKQHPIEVVARYLVVVKQKLGDKSLDYTAMEPFKKTHDIYSLYVNLMGYYRAQCVFLWPEFVDNATFDPFPLHFIHSIFKKDVASTEIARYELFLNDEFQGVIESGFALHDNLDTSLLSKTHNKHIVDIPRPCIATMPIPETSGPTRLQVNDKISDISKDYLYCLGLFSASFGKPNQPIVPIAMVLSQSAFAAFSALSTIRQIDTAKYLVSPSNRFVCQIHLFVSFLWWVCDEPLCYRTLMTIDTLYHNVYSNDSLALLTYYHMRAVFALRFSPDKQDISNMIESLIVHTARITTYTQKYLSTPALLYFSSYLAEGKTLDKVWRKARSNLNQVNNDNNDNNNNNNNNNNKK
jgi:hypothetical protein